MLIYLHYFTKEEIYEKLLCWLFSIMSHLCNREEFKVPWIVSEQQILWGQLVAKRGGIWLRSDAFLARMMFPLCLVLFLDRYVRCAESLNSKLNSSIRTNEEARLIYWSQGLKHGARKWFWTFTLVVCVYSISLQMGCKASKDRKRPRN